jgi:hypothetical protein
LGAVVLCDRAFQRATIAVSSRSSYGFLRVLPPAVRMFATAYVAKCARFIEMASM